MEKDFIFLEILSYTDYVRDFYIALFVLILLAAAFEAFSLTTILDPYSELEYEEIQVYYIDQKPDGCTCECYEDNEHFIFESN